MNCPQVKQKFQELKTLKQKFETQLEKTRLNGKPCDLFVLKKEIEEKLIDIKSQPGMESLNNELTGNIAEQIKTAQEILGIENVIDHTVSEELYGLTINPEDIPNIQFTKEDLVAVKQRREKGELFETLVFIPPNQTMESTQNVLKQKTNTEEMKSTGGLRYINDDIKNNHFQSQETKGKWILASSSLEKTRNKTAPIQLKIAIEELEKMHNNDIPERYQENIKKFQEEFQTKLKEILNQDISSKSNNEIDDLIYDTINNNEIRKKLTDWLVEVDIAKQLTTNFSESFAIFALRYQNSKTDTQKEQLNKDYGEYSRIFERVESVSLALVGFLNPRGVDFDDWSPGYRNGNGLLSFSRN